MTSELKPCPFCGGTRATITSECDIDTEGKFYRVECLDCRTKTKEHYARETCPILYESVRNDWNTRATPSVDSHPCNTKDIECQQVQNLEHKTELENIVQDAVNKTLAQPKYRRGQYIIEDSELQKYATPSTDTLAGLVRYGISMFGNGAVEMGGGEYVLYSEAAAIISAKDAEIEQLKEQNNKFKWQVRDTCTRAEAAEAELAETKMLLQNERDQQVHEELAYVKAELDKLKAQEPVGWFHFCISTGEYTAEWCRVNPYDQHGFRPLYASPVSDSLKAASKTLVGILTNALNDEDVNCGSVAGGYLCGDAMSDAIAEVRAALNVEASPLAPEGGRE